ncbi:MAG: radical SAM protein, partial [Candidatus Omnitrophica bacterium]|nr:radical SAM protein [Candidatus Omnitrophota bacterium]
FDFGLIGFDFRVEVFNNLVLEDLERGEIEFNSDDLVLILKQYQNFVDKNLSEEEIRLAIEILRFRFIEAFYRMFVKGGQSDVTNNGEKLDYAMRAQKSFLRFLDRCASSKTIGDFVREITGCTECLYSEKAVSVNFPAADVRITIGVNGKNEFFSTVKREAGSVYEDELAVLRKAMDSALKMMMKNDFTKVLAWLGDDKYREIKLNIHGREGVVCEADVQRNELYLSWRAMRAPPEWNAVPASYAGELSLSLPFFLYHGLRHLIVRGQSEAIVQFNVIEQLRETLKETPEVLNAYLKIISPSLDNGITGTDFWFNILSAIQKKQVLQFSASVPLSQTEILVSVDARYNDRVNLNHADPSMTTYINDLPWDGVLPFPDVDIHIDSMRAEIGDRDYLVIPQCNPYINDHVIIFQGGRIYHRRGEFNRNGFAVHAGKERTYTCLVVYKNGKTAIERLRLLKDMAGISDKVYLDSKDVTSDVLLAMYGQQIVRDGMVFDPAEREFDSPGEFPDHRQLQGKYSHDLLALNDRGELQVLSLSGNRKEGVGVTIRQAAEFAVSQGARDAVLFSNGGDVNLRLNEHMVAESPAGYNPVKTFSSAVIAVAFPRGAARIESSFDGGIRARRIAHGVKSQEELQEMIGLGFTIFEVDVQMTSDKKLTAYWDTIDEKCVYDYTFEQLKAKLEPSMEYKLLDIAEMLEVIHDNNLTVYLDLKDWPTYKYNKGMNQEYNKYEDYQRLFLDEIKAQVERFGLENQVFAGAFNFDYLRELKRSTPYIKTYFAAEKLTEKSEFESAEEKKLRIEKEVEKLVKIKDDLNATGVFIYEKYLRENEELIGELHGKNMEIVTKFLKDSEKFGTVALNADFIAVDLENYSEFTGMVEALKASDIDGGNRAYSYALGAGILLSLVLGAELEAIYLASALIFSWLFWRMFLATGFYPVMFPRVVVYITLIGGMLMFGFVPADDMGRVVAAMIGFPAGFGVFVLSARKMIEDFQREQLRVEGEWNDRFNRDGGEKAVGIIVPSDFISVSRRYLSNAVIRAPPVKRFSVVLLFLLFVSAIVVIPASAAPDFFFDLFNKSLSELIGLGKAENLVDNFINAAILVAVIASLGEITGKVFHARKGIGVLFAVIVMTLAVMPGDILFWGIVLIGFIPGYFNGRDTSVGYPWSPSLQPVRLSDRDFALWAQDALNSIKDGRSEAFMARNDVGDLFKRYFFSMLLEARMYKSALIWAAIISWTFTASVMNYYPLEQMWAYIWFVPAAFVLGWSIGNLVRYIKGQSDRESTAAPSYYDGGESFRLAQLLSATGLLFATVLVAGFIFETAALFGVDALGLMDVFLFNAFLGALADLLTDVFSWYYWVSLFYSLLVAVVSYYSFKRLMRKTSLSALNRQKAVWILTGMATSFAAMIIREFVVIGIDISGLEFVASWPVVFIVLAVILSSGAISGLVINQAESDRLLTNGGVIGMIHGAFYQVFLSNWYSSGTVEELALLVGLNFSVVFGASIGIALFRYFAGMYGVDEKFLSDVEDREEGGTRDYVRSAAENEEKIVVQENIVPRHTIFDLVFSIKKRLASNPEKKAGDLMRELDISKEELLSAYRFIKYSPELQQSLIADSGMPVVANDLAQLLNNRAFVEAFLSGEPVCPSIVEIHPGIACCYNCVFCYNKCDSEKPKMYYDMERFGRMPLTPERAEQIVEEFAKKGVKQIWISGGLEPFTSKETVLAIMKKAQAYNIKTRIYTNGQFFDENVQEIAAHSGWVRFSV